MTQYRAINDSVIVEIPEVETMQQRESGLLLIQKDPTTKSTVTGTIVSIGEGRWDEKSGSFVPPPVKVGDKIILSRSTGVEIDKTHRMIRTDDIFAVVE